MECTLTQRRPAPGISTSHLVAAGACAAAALQAALWTGHWADTQAPALPAPAISQVMHAPTYEQAVALLCAGRHAEAYGRFVALADDGDVRAGRVAMILHRLGPSWFGSDWDASTDQLETWARWSDAQAIEKFTASPPPLEAQKAIARGAGSRRAPTGDRPAILNALCANASRTSAESDAGADPSPWAARRNLEQPFVRP